jgi:hypothetical protein
MISLKVVSPGDRDMLMSNEKRADVLSQGGLMRIWNLGVRITSLLVLGVPLFAIPEAFGAPPAPCQALPAETWSSIMGYAATATPGPMYCTYESKTGGGQFRILAIAASSAEAEAAAKRIRDQQPKGNRNASLGVVDSQGTVVFSIALFQEAATPNTASQLQRLVASAKQRLPK